MKINPYTKRPYGDEEPPTAAPPWFPYRHLTLQQIRIGVCPDCFGRSRWYRADHCRTCRNTGRIK